VPESTLGAPGSVGEPMRKSQTNCERFQRWYSYSFGGLLVLSENLRMSTSNRFPSTANMIHGILFIINSESYLGTIFFNTVFIALLHYGTKEKGM
jgi:hypothetical protein